MTSQIIREYFTKVHTVYQTGVATEHSYRSALEWLFDKIEEGVTAVNEPKGVEVGRPDFVFQRVVNHITVGHCEAKDINIDVTPKTMDKSNKAQFDRYVKGLPNLIYTNCLDFHFYKNGELVREIKIADYLKGLQVDETQFEPLWNQLKDFCAKRMQTITSAEKLAEMMAGKATLIKDILFNMLKEDKELTSELAGQFKAFKDQLIHDLEIDEFSDIYAETIAYGMFAARLHDDTKQDFTRIQALELLPKSNPFLKNLFGYLAGPNLEDSLRRTIDELAEIFQATDLQKLFENFGSFTQRNDPFIHFYETFLAAYNPLKRKARGVWYTPEPVVNFIVRAVDEVLQTEFGLPDGLADTSKVTIDWDTGQTDKKGKPLTIKKNVHRVQILDPATGTGTFLAEVIKQIAPKIQGVAPGMWSQYIEDDLIPRLHGFEILVASYAMCHMKLDMVLTELGYKPTSSPPRLSVYLTNSLEEGEPANQTLPFTQWLSREAKGANTIKRDMPIMCVIGNPPYLGEGGVSKGWIGNMMDDYKKEPGGKVKLKERNSKWLNDLYVKFIRLSSHLIEKNDEGILGFITNHGYLDNPTFRGMRWHLMNTFDRIWVLDLHGNANKKEVTPEGKPDKNVFDIQQGVSIIIGMKRKGGGKGLAEVMHGDLWGTQDVKHKALQSTKLITSIFSKLESPAPQHPFVPRNFELQDHYDKGIELRKFFVETTTGMQTGADKRLIGEDREELCLSLSKEGRSNSQIKDQTVTISYRPFDKRWVYYCAVRSRNPLSFIKLPASYRSRSVAIKNLSFENPALLFPRRLAGNDFHHAFIADALPEMCVISNRTREQNVVAPLYLYPDEQDIDQTRRVNFDHKLCKNIQKMADHPDHGKPDEKHVFDYIYGVLHCPAYRETYAEFLKIDFPRIPWPTTPDEFWDVSTKGTELRKLHLMESASIGVTPYPFTGEGDNLIDKPRFEDGRIWINNSQYFADPPVVSWDFYIGGYQPAQKWLKDRKGRVLSFEDVKHYQRILKILSETDRIMQTIMMNFLE